MKIINEREREKFDSKLFISKFSVRRYIPDGLMNKNNDLALGASISIASEGIISVQCMYLEITKCLPHI